MPQFIVLADDGHRFTCKMPADQTAVVVRLKDGSTCRAYYSCNIAEAGDFDFVPLLDGESEPDLLRDSIADMVVAWRPQFDESPPLG